MRVVVHDASVLIDLGAAELLDSWFSLEIETLTTSLVWREVTRRAHRVKLRQFGRADMIQVIAMNMENFVGGRSFETGLASKPDTQ